MKKVMVLLKAMLILLFLTSCASHGTTVPKAFIGSAEIFQVDDTGTVKVKGYNLKNQPTHWAFVHCDYSQKNFKPNFEKFEKILINSSQQCGRSSIIKLELEPCLKDFLITYPNTFVLNFSNKNVSDCDISTIALGCEGGFSKDELSLFSSNRIVGFNTKLILRSETAITAMSSKILL